MALSHCLISQMMLQSDIRAVLNYIYQKLHYNYSKPVGYYQREQTQIAHNHLYKDPYKRLCLPWYQMAIINIVVLTKTQWYLL